MVVVYPDTRDCRLSAAGSGHAPRAHGVSFIKSARELRDLYREHLFERVYFGNEKRPENWQVQYALNGIPYYRSHYFEWLRNFPRREVQNYTKNQLASGKYEKLTRATGHPENLRNRFSRGILPVSLLCRPPTKFSRSDEKKHDVKVGRGGLVLFMHGSPNGGSARAGFKDVLLRPVPGTWLKESGCWNRIEIALRPYQSEIEMCLRDGEFEEAVDITLLVINEVMQKWEFNNAV